MQKTTARSTEEAQYSSASTAAMEIVYLLSLQESLGFAQKKPTPIYEDNSACIEWRHNVRVIGGREGAKPIDVRKHLAHEVVVKVSTSAQLAAGGHPDQRTTPSAEPHVRGGASEGILGRRRT
jgi:hypothetical protein